MSRADLAAGSPLNVSLVLVHRFSATVEKIGINPCVRVPGRISRAFQKRGYVPVCVHLERGMVLSTLVPVGGGVHRLYINGAMLRFCDSRVGDEISLGVEIDDRDRSLKTPEDILALLRADGLIEKRWSALAPSKRNEILRYISFAKTPDTRSRNVAKLMRILQSSTGRGILSGIKIEIKIYEG